MKYFLRFFILLFSFCSGLSAKQIDLGTATEVAESFIRGSSSLRTTQTTSLKLVHTAAESKSRTTGTPNAYYYVFNIGENKGFIIISADDVNTPILGYSNTGSYDPDNLPDNFRSWMNTIVLGMEQAISQGAAPSKEVQVEWENFRRGQAIYSKSARVVVVEPLIKTTWNQSEPYNRLIPYSGLPTGCVATATAQIMKYYNHPKSGRGVTTAYSVNNDNTTYSIPAIDLSKYTYDWNNMLTTYSYSAPGNESQKNAVALLMYHIGASVEMGYGKAGSGAQSRNAAKALFTYFDYDKSLELRERYDYLTDANNAWDAMLKKELNSRRPVYYDGSGNGAHAFICDGYDDQGFFHFNWGWGGSSDGYFKTTAPLGYTNWQSAMVNIKPNEGGLLKPKLELKKDYTSISTDITSGKRGTKFTTRFSFKNVSLTSFKGYYGVALTDNSDNIKYIIDQSGLSELGSGYYYSQFSFVNCLLPLDAVPGKYKLRMVAKPEGETNWTIVTNPASSVINNIPFEILEGTESAKLQIYSTTPLFVSKNPAKAGESVAVKLSFVNFSGIIFKGYYGIALTDDSDNIKYVLAQSGLSQLGLNNYFPEYNFSYCLIPGNAVPGKYKLRMVSKLEGDINWVVVKSVSSSVIDYLPFEISGNSTQSFKSSLVSDQISIYPNPVVDNLHIQSAEKVNKVAIYDLSGRIVLQKNETELVNQTIPVSNLQSGVYIVYIYTDQGKTTHKLIKE